MISIYIVISFLFSYIPLFHSNNNSTVKIAIVSVDSKNLKEAKEISRFLESYYDCKVDILRAITAPPESYKNQSDTLMAFKILIHLNEIFIKAHYDKYMALTEKPIYLNENFPYIRGLGIYNGSSCIVSMNKIRKEAKTDEKLFKAYLKKVSRHEIGHTLGLKHCEHKSNCLMASGVNDSLFVKIQPILCESCSTELNEFIRDSKD